MGNLPFPDLTGSQARAWEPRARGSASLADKNKNRRQMLMECVPRLWPGNEQTPTLCANDGESAHSSLGSD